MDTALNGWGARCDCRIPWGWRLRHSLWALAAPLGLGVLSWVSFVYLAARVRRTGLTLVAAVFTVAGLIAGYSSMAKPQNEQLSGLLIVFTWAAAIVTAIILNSSYVRWRWRQDGRCRCATVEDGFPREAGGESAIYRRAPLELPAQPQRSTALAGAEVAAEGSTRSVVPDAEQRSQHIVAAPVSEVFDDDDSIRQEPDLGVSPVDAETREIASALNPTAPPLGRALVASSTYAQHKTVVRVVLDDTVVSRVVDEMAAAPGGRLSIPQAAAALEVPLSRVGGGITCLARQLNVDGYGIVRRDGDFVVLDAALLREQFSI